MPSPLVHQISAVEDALYGVNILEIPPALVVQGGDSTGVAIVGEFPFGPVNTLTPVTLATLYEQFAPLEFGVLSSQFPALRALFNKRFPGRVLMVRVSPAGLATATLTFQDSTPADSVVVSALYGGAQGNNVQITWSANADLPANRDMTVTVGTSYARTYANVVVDNTGSITVNDPGDRFVSVAAAVGAVAPPAAVAATNLASGADGTAIAGDYATAIEALADVTEDWAVGFVAEPPDALVASINASLKTFADTHERGILVGNVPVGQTDTAAISAVASYRTDRIWMPWPRAFTIDPDDPNRREIEVEANSFWAVALAATNPFRSPGGVTGKPSLTGITRFSSGATAQQLKLLNDAGVSPGIMVRGEALIHLAVTTSLTADLTRIFRRRATDFVMDAMAVFLEGFVETPADINLTDRTLGDNTFAMDAGLRTFLNGLRTSGEIEDFSVDMFSAQTANQLASGIIVPGFQLKLFGMAERIVLRGEVGTQVNIVQAS